MISYNNNQEVQFVLNWDDDVKIGYIQLDGDHTKVRYKRGHYELSDIKHMLPNTREYNLRRLVLNEKLHKNAESFEYDENHNKVLVNTTYIQYTSYQRALFEHVYALTNCATDLNYVNFFAPSSCYYPLGWYNLGGEKSDIADRIGEKVDMMWQMWKDSLWYNNYLENITSKEVTYYEYSA